MKAYTLDKLGIVVGDGGINVGESGRGRLRVSVPLPPKSLVVDGILVSCDGPDNLAIVLIPDQSGFRGSWRLRGALTEAEWDAVAAGSTDAIDERPHGLHVIAEGRSAQGDAGRMGGGPDYLLQMSDGQAVEIVRSGRLYGDLPVFRLAFVDGQVSITDPLSAAMSRKAAGKWLGGSC